VIPHAPVSGTELAIAAGLGILAGFGSGLLTMLVYAFEDLFQKLPFHWMWWPAIGAVFVGVGGIIEPRVLGVGYDTIHSLLRGELVGAAIIGLLVAKTLVWSIALGSGTSSWGLEHEGSASESSLCLPDSDLRLQVVLFKQLAMIVLNRFPSFFHDSVVVQNRSSP
jgi:hypothetical protein